MSKTLILIVMVIYGWVAAEQAYARNWPGVLLWGAYAIANLGLALQAK